MKLGSGNLSCATPSPLETAIDRIYETATSAAPDSSLLPYLVSAFLAPAQAVLWTRHPDTRFLRAEPSHRLSAPVLRNNELEISLGAVRPSESPGFSKFEISLFGSLVPHLRRAMAMQQQLAGAALRSRQVREVLDRLAAAVMVLDGLGGVLLANRRAQEILASGGVFVVEQGRLRAVGEQARRSLEGAIARATRRSNEQPKPLGAAFLLPRATGPGPLAALVLPSRPHLGWMAELSPAVVLLVTDPMRDETPEATLRELYGLTRAEATMLAALLSGEGLQRAAIRLGISPNTAKAHLARILDKTEAGGQTGLIRLVHGGLGLLSRD
jgi:DNA-binding CsgD family transcriptional regulator